MIDLKRTKELLGDESMPDAEAKEIRECFYSIAELIFEKWSDERREEIKTREYEKRSKKI